MLECEENHTQPTKKERESIKMKYDSFNTSFEDICRTQQQYAIPSKVRAGGWGRGGGGEVAATTC